MVSLRMGRRGLLVVAAVLALVGSACNSDWSQFGYDSGHSQATPETSITTANVASLTLAWTATFALGGEAIGSVAVANGVVYTAGADGTVSAFDAAGSIGCSGSPKRCTPLWTAKVGRVPLLAPAVVNGILYVDSHSGTLSAFDAGGVTNCSGSPKTCQPLWTVSVGTAVGGVAGGFVVADGTLYLEHGPVAVGTDGDNTIIVAAYDASGSTGCGGTPRTCSPQWTAQLGHGSATAPTVANGVLYVGGGPVYNLSAFDAHGVSGCGGIPRTCTPLWSAVVPGWTYDPPAVVNGTVYIATDGGGLFAFDGNGTSGCSGVPKTCEPLWRSAISDEMLTATSQMPTSPAVAGNVVYVGSGVAGGTLGSLLAFDASGLTGCSGVPKRCEPRWTAGHGVNGTNNPVVAGGVVFAATVLHGIQAFDAAGKIGCSGTPTDCTPLWTSPINYEDTVVVSQGSLYATSGLNGLEVFVPTK